jgi:cytochrome c oxidase cbb3-type subunit I/II
VIFAFVGNMMFAGIYYSTQRLLQGAHGQRRAELVPLLGLAGDHRRAAITLPLGSPRARSTPS